MNTRLPREVDSEISADISLLNIHNGRHSAHFTYSVLGGLLLAFPKTHGHHHFFGVLEHLAEVLATERGASGSFWRRMVRERVCR